VHSESNLCEVAVPLNASSRISEDICTQSFVFTTVVSASGPGSAIASMVTTYSPLGGKDGTSEASSIVARVTLDMNSTTAMPS